jgi:glutamate receptor, ionotropic, invertebrate
VDVSDGLTAEKLRVETALMYDGVLLLAEALKDLEGHTQLETVSLKCNDAATWKNGYSIVNYMKTVGSFSYQLFSNSFIPLCFQSIIYGLSRVIKFDHHGHRSNFLLDIVELGQEGLKKIGTWNSTEGLKMAREQDIAQSALDDGSLRNKTFVVITALVSKLLAAFGIWPAVCLLELLEQFPYASWLM